MNGDKNDLIVQGAEWCDRRQMSSCSYTYRSYHGQSMVAVRYPPKMAAPRHNAPWFPFPPLQNLYSWPNQSVCVYMCNEDRWLVWGASVAEQVGWWWVMMVVSQRQWLPSWTEYRWSWSLTVAWTYKPCALFVHFASHKHEISCLIQTSYPCQTNEFHLDVVKTSRCFITVLKSLLMFSNDILQFDKWDKEEWEITFNTSLWLIPYPPGLTDIK